MFTVRRLGVRPAGQDLVVDHPVESMISIARSTTRNVKRWRDGEMVRRWVAAGMLNAEPSFRRRKGHAGAGGGAGPSLPSRWVSG